MRDRSTYVSMSSDACLGQPEPESRVSVVDLYYLQERVKRSQGVAAIELEQTKVVEKNMTTIHTKDSEWTARERIGCTRRDGYHVNFICKIFVLEIFV